MLPKGAYYLLTGLLAINNIVPLDNVMLNCYAFCNYSKLFEIDCPSSSQLNTTTSLKYFHTNYQSWDEQLNINGLWTTIVKDANDIIKLSNWAATYGYKLRPSGFQHNWSPLLVTKHTTSYDKLILVDTTKYLTRINILELNSSATVRVQTGTSLQNLLEYLEKHGYTLASTYPAAGEISVGGAIAIDGHGTGVPMKHENTSGKSFGSLSSIIIELKAIVWNKDQNSFELKTFHKNEAEMGAFTTSLGRAFLVEVTLRLIPSFNLLCISHTDISIDELLLHPKKVKPKSRTISKYVDEYGRIEIILFPFMSNPWLKLWKQVDKKPTFALQVYSPYSYKFSDNLPKFISDLSEQVTKGTWDLTTPMYGFLQLTTVQTSLGLSGLSNIWGSSKNLLLYIKHSTLRVASGGYAILTKRSSLQLVLHKFYTFYNELITTYQNQKLYPANCPLDIRISGLDNEHSHPSLSAAQPDKNHPEFNVVIWLSIVSLPGTPNSNEFLMKLEKYLFGQFSKELSNLVTVRPEWSKGWAYTKDSAWSNKNILEKYIPISFKENWNLTLSTLNKYDPYRVFSNKFLDEFLQ